MSDQKQLHRDTIWVVRAFTCPVCHAFTPFEADRCANCGAAVGLHLPTKSMLSDLDGDAVVDGQRWIRCTQSETLDCNWLVPRGQRMPISAAGVVGLADPPRTRRPQTRWPERSWCRQPGRCAVWCTS